MTQRTSTELLPDGRTCVRAAGSIDVYTAPAWRDELQALIAGGAQDLVVDLREVEWLDATALGVLVGTLKQAQAFGGSMSVFGASGDGVAKVFRITGLTKVFPTYDSAELPMAP